jgi:hypothetical protein
MFRGFVARGKLVPNYVTTCSHLSPVALRLLLLMTNNKREAYTAS